MSYTYAHKDYPADSFAEAWRAFALDAEVFDHLDITTGEPVRRMSDAYSLIGWSWMGSSTEESAGATVKPDHAPFPGPGNLRVYLR